MSTSCATVAELVEYFPELAGLGARSRGSVLVAALPLVGDELTITSVSPSWPPVVETLVAGTDYAPGATTDDTAIAIVAALAGSALVEAAAVGSSVELRSIAKGVVSELPTTATGVGLVPAQATLVGGAQAAADALTVACGLIDPECYGTRTTQASALLAAHYLSVSQGVDDGGRVSWRKIDKIELRHAVKPGGELESTRYGRTFLELRRSVTTLHFAIPGRRVLPRLH